MTGEIGEADTPESDVEVAPVVVQAKVTGWPAVMLVADAVKLLMAGRTVTVAVAVVVPTTLEVVSV